MILYILGHTYKYETEKVIRLFYPVEKITAVTKDFPSEDKRAVYTYVKEEEEAVIFSCKALIDGKTAEYSFSYIKDSLDSPSHRERLLAKAVVRVLREITGIVPPWGILTGIRPAKLMRGYINSEGKEKAEEIFRDFFEVSEEKTALAKSVAEYENISIAMSGKNSFSLYISIPFCPTRCSYCSFVSHSVESAKKLIPDYVEKLSEEIRLTGKIARETCLVPETVYIGGGTPTAFSAEDLIKITSAVREAFDMEKVREFTVEAGRPDTIDEKKLLAIKNAGVTRISINPQTFSDSVLKAVGRPHTAEDTIEKFLLARRLGFDNINMDLIAGLPTDTPESFKKSIDKAIELSPENITVHTLSLKRSASLVTENEADGICTLTEEMVNYANKCLSENGYTPYYMYRQSKSVGNLENVGWCKKGKPCLYNIYMMEEIHTVLACGASAVTKLKNEETLERVYNYKYPYEYISRFSDMVDRKEEIRRFYGIKQVPEA